VLAGDVQARGERCAVLFGRERSGLANHDIMLAHTIVTVPLNPAYSSLNLAQGVLLIGYEWFQAGVATPAETLPRSHSRTARSEEVQAFLDHLDRELEAAEFYKEANLRAAMERNLRIIFLRARLTDQEVRTLRGVVARLAARRTRG
jgi:tRNA/rRNA methyltransferase